MPTLNLLSEVELVHGIRRRVSLLCEAHDKEGSSLAGVCRGAIKSVHWSSVVLGPSRYEECVTIASAETTSSTTGDDNSEDSR